MHLDNYVVSTDKVREPPRSFFHKLRFLGPGFILPASIVGSGELIATTILGAKAGFIAFWVIILSCLIKVAIQLEFGKAAIITGNTPMTSFSNFSGRSKWAVWTVFVLTLLKVIQVGGMLGGAALVLYQLLPAVHLYVWVVLLGIVVAVLIYRNYYRLVETASLVMVALFTLFTLISLVSLLFTSFSFNFSDILGGMTFQLPSSYIIYAIGAFGITGVASDEIIAYNYWCIEKGYAAYTGPSEDSEAWRQRAKGWISVMRLDAIVAMVIYTLVTAAFYLLGASVLAGRSIPEGNELISFLANIYTKTLGEGVKTVYLAGAFFVLYSSVFATLAYWTRLFTDVFRQFGWIEESRRRLSVAFLAWVFPFTWMLAYFFIELPALMILSGGVVGSVLLLLVSYAAIWFRYGKDHLFSRSWPGDFFLWLSVSSIALLGIYGMIKIAEELV